MSGSMWTVIFTGRVICSFRVFSRLSVISCAAAMFKSGLTWILHKILLNFFEQFSGDFSEVGPDIILDTVPSFAYLAFLIVDLVHQFLYLLL